MTLGAVFVAFLATASTSSGLAQQHGLFNILHHSIIFTMDSGTIIIGVIALAICILPFIALSRSRKKTEQQRLSALQNFAARQNCQLSEYEFCGNLSIGLDMVNKCVFALRKTEGGEISQYINLHGVQQCKAIQTSRNLNSKEGEYKVIDRIDLSFVPVAKNEPDTLLEIFNAQENLQMVGELQLADRWEKRISNLLRGKAA